MNIPNLPTDNLYKFIALSGVVISLICTISPNFIIKEIGDEITTFKTEQGELRLEITILKESKDELENNIAKIDTMLSQYEYDDSTNANIVLSDLIESLQDPEHRDYLQFVFENKHDIFPIFKLNEENANRTRQLIEITNEILLKAHRIERKAELIRLKNKDIRASIWKWSMGLLAGVIMMCLGFKLWYIKVQKPLDEKLKKRNNGA